MAMTQKVNANPLVKHLMRQIAKISNPEMGYQTVDEVDRDLSSLVFQGYKVVSTHYLGQQMDTNRNVPYYGILYVLQMEQAEVERLRQAARREAEKE